MKSFIPIIAIGLFSIILVSCKNVPVATLEPRIENISKSEMQSIMEFLGHDLLEGRAPGTRGGYLAEIYMQSLFKFMNLEPGNNGSYFQPFKMKGFSNNGFNISANGVQLQYLDDVVGTFSVKYEMIDYSADAVFVGFGIKTEVWEWDDYKDIDLTNKLVITRVNDPGMLDPNIFEGKTLTYFGRWTYHIEEAARRGAAGILLIHTDESAGYDWNVVRNSWSGEELFIESDLQNKLKFRGWIKESSLVQILHSKNLSIEDLYENNSSREFQPRELGFCVNIEGKNTIREVTNQNVIAHITGKSEETIVLSAHIDHLGVGQAVKGDSVYNGAIDNGSAVAAMLLTAKVLKEHQHLLHYSITVLACNAEESGLLGSKYFVQNSNHKNIVANINFESTPVWKASKSIMGIGARFSGFEGLIKQLAAKNGLEYSSFSLSNQGLFYRSDQFPFARYGIPSVWISAGEDEISGEKNYTQFWRGDYHTVKDEYDPNWDLGAMKQTIKYALLLIDEMNNTKVIPQWKDGLPFPTK